MEVEFVWGGGWCANPFSCQTHLSRVKLRLSWGCDNYNNIYNTVLLQVLGGDSECMECVKTVCRKLHIRSCQ